MARRRAPDTETEQDNGGVYNRPNAEVALKILDTEIKPRKAFIQEKTGDLSDPYKRVKDECHFPRSILDLIAKFDGMEDAKRDHNLLALHLALELRGYRRPLDLVSMAEGAQGNEPIVKAGATGGRPKLATVPDHTGGDDDLAEAGGAEPTDLDLGASKDGDKANPFEATDEELAKQEGRGKSRGKGKDKAEPGYGTGAAAMAAMSGSTQLN